MLKVCNDLFSVFFVSCFMKWINCFAKKWRCLFKRFQDVSKALVGLRGSREKRRQIIAQKLVAILLKYLVNFDWRRLTMKVLIVRASKSKVFVDFRGQKNWIRQNIPWRLKFNPGVLCRMGLCFLSFLKQIS